MKKYVIIGNSAAGIAAAETIRGQDAQGRISIISDEDTLPYERHRVLDVLEGRAKEKDLVFRDEDFYKKNSIDLLSGREVVALHLTRKRVAFKDKETLDFDELIIASGSAVKLSQIKGIQKEGVVALDGLNDVKFLRENLPLAHTVVVVGSDETARRLARIVAAKKIEVKFFGDFPCASEGIDVMHGHSIIEILGESEVRAVRLANNKVVGANLVVFTQPRKPRLDFLRDTEIKTREGILVDGAMRTNIPFVFAAGDVSEPAEEQAKSCGWEAAVLEGRSIRFSG